MRTIMHYYIHVVLTEEIKLNQILGELHITGSISISFITIILRVSFCW